MRKPLLLAAAGLAVAAEYDNLGNGVKVVLSEQAAPLAKASP
jgi:hypothetical protein